MKWGTKPTFAMWKVYKCVELNCKTTVYKMGERCWLCWLKHRNATLKKYQK